MGPDEEEELLRFEGNLISFLRDDPRLLPYAPGLTAECFRNPKNAKTFRDIGAGAEIGWRTGEVLGGHRVREWTRRLIAAAPNRPQWVEPPPSQPSGEACRREQGAKPEPKRDAPARSTKRVTSGPLFTKEQNQIRHELGVFYRWDRHQGKHFTPEMLDSFIAALRQAFAPRNPLDPNNVSPQDLGKHFRLTYDRRHWIEDQETERRTKARWQKRFNKSPRFRFHKIGVDPADTSPEVVAQRYKEARQLARNEARRAERFMAKQKETNMSTTNNPTTEDWRQRRAKLYAAARAAGTTATRRQMEDLLDAIGVGERNTSELVELVRNKLAWRDIEERKLRQTMIDRLDALEEDGLITTVRHDPGPRGSRLRVVRRT